MGCSFVRSVLAWENIVVKSEKVKTVSVSHHLLPWLFRFTTVVWATRFLIICLKQWFSSRGDCAPKGTFNNFLRHFCLSQLASDGVCYWHLVGRG